MPELLVQPVSRVDGTLKVTGRATYAYEQKVPNAAYGVLVMSSIAKGRITSLDSREAERSKGVVLVMSHLNVPNRNWKNRTVPVLRDARRGG